MTKIIQHKANRIYHKIITETDTFQTCKNYRSSSHKN